MSAAIFQFITFACSENLKPAAFMLFATFACSENL